LTFAALNNYNVLSINCKVGTLKRYSIYKETVKINFKGHIMTKKSQLPDCPVETTLTLIGDKWKTLIVRDLLTGKKRFGELKKSLNGISQKVLTQHLRIMEDKGLVNRKIYAQVPPKVEYSLTNLGCSLKSVLEGMKKWGENYKTKINSQGRKDK
jgi:DNA-binding HxlR family transcriptional regulator